ncbi:YdeI/OmpD-associated family protein [Jannaschia donghaensis]|uniref:YdeI/OmpD-associated family protein n=1 Tax=Jannaschia donghaensis TaxID=420998 RepID=UPI001C9DD749|nr:YdeI/OmpD-associated family protein [Jannaschia donghaensis]
MEIASEPALWAWLEAHYERDRGVWLVTWKAAHRDRYLSRDAVLDALIAYGWIDGRRMKLDADRTMQLIAPRKQQAWAATYRERANRLETAGRMRAPGRAVIARDRASGLWDAMAHVDALEDPADLILALEARDAWPWWTDAAPSYRRNVLRWIAQAKADATRAKRVAIVAEHAARGEKVPNY